MSIRPPIRISHYSVRCAGLNTLETDAMISDAIFSELRAPEIRRTP
jgi:hypothetical protein